MIAVIPMLVERAHHRRDHLALLHCLLDPMVFSLFIILSFHITYIPSIRVIFHSPSLPYSISISKKKMLNSLFKLKQLWTLICLLDASSSGLCRHPPFRSIRCLIGTQCLSKSFITTNFRPMFLLLFCVFSGMEQFWQSAFAWFFRPLWINSDHLWTLSPISSPPVCNEWPWHAITYSAKVRFQCPVSLHPWLTNYKMTQF